MSPDPPPMPVAHCLVVGIESNEPAIKLGDTRRSAAEYDCSKNQSCERGPLRRLGRACFAHASLRRARLARRERRFGRSAQPASPGARWVGGQGATRHVVLAGRQQDYRTRADVKERWREEKSTGARVSARRRLQNLPRSQARVRGASMGHWTQYRSGSLYIGSGAGVAAVEADAVRRRRQHQQANRKCRRAAVAATLPGWPSSCVTFAWPPRDSTSASSGGRRTPTRSYHVPACLLDADRQPRSYACSCVSSGHSHGCGAAPERFPAALARSRIAPHDLERGVGCGTQHPNVMTGFSWTLSTT